LKKITVSARASLIEHVFLRVFDHYYSLSLFYSLQAETRTTNTASKFQQGPELLIIWQ